MNELGIKKANRAVRDICLDYTFYGGFLMQMDIIATDEVERAGTDGLKVYFNPDFFAQLTHAGAMFVFVHEALHVMLKHHLRKGKRDHDLYNQAGDYVIHCLMAEDGFRILDWVLYNSDFDNLTTGQVYEILAKDAQSKPNQQPDATCAGQGGKGTISGEMPVDGNGQPMQGHGIGDVDQQTNEDGSPMDAGQRAEAEAKIDRAVAQAINSARAAGTMSAGQERFVQTLLEPRVPWQDVLRQYFEQFARDDYNFSIPNRRYTQMGLYMPTLKSEEMPDIAVLVDTSGSVSGDELNMYMSEIYHMLTSFKVRIHVIYVDSAFAGHQVFNSDEFWNIDEFDPKGFGGTDFRPGFEYMEENDINPCVCVYFTDLDCLGFPDTPDFPVLWGATNPYYYGKRKLPFGEIIEMVDPL